MSKSFLIVGATGGIGRVLVEALAKRGHALTLAARDADRVDALARHVGAEGLGLEARDPDAVERAVTAVVERHGRIDGAVNLAGSLLLKPAHLTKPAEWDDVVATNLGSAFHLVRAAGRAMRRDGGSIVLVSSAAAGVGIVNHDAIAAAKAGVEGLARSAAATYASQGIRVNCVAPGLVRTPLTQRLTGGAANRLTSGHRNHDPGSQPSTCAVWKASTSCRPMMWRSSKETKKESPCVSTSCPPHSVKVLRRMRCCSTSRSTYCSRSCLRRAVEPSVSEKRKVTVPAGNEALISPTLV